MNAFLPVLFTVSGAIYVLQKVQVRKPLFLCLIRTIQRVNYRFHTTGEYDSNSFSHGYFRSVAKIANHISRLFSSYASSSKNRGVGTVFSAHLHGFVYTTLISVTHWFSSYENLEWGGTLFSRHRSVGPFVLRIFAENGENDNLVRARSELFSEGVASSCKTPYRGDYACLINVLREWRWIGVIIVITRDNCSKREIPYATLLT